MSDSTYRSVPRPVYWLGPRVKSPPFSKAARAAVGRHIGDLQEGRSIGMPHSRPMPDIGQRCHELRVQDDRVSWRIVYRTDPNAILIVDVFAKATPRTPPHILEVCRKRLRVYDARKRRI